MLFVLSYKLLIYSFMRTLTILTVALLIQACGTSDSKEKKTMPHENEIEGTGHVEELNNDPRKIGGAKSIDQETIEAAELKMKEAKENQILGYWVGDFGKNKINLALYELRADSVFGFSICAGNFRPVKGIISEESDITFDLKLVEPGTDQYDGVFTCAIDKVVDEMSGSWEPFQEAGNSSKDFNLNKRAYNYDQTVGQYPQASQRVLNVEDVENLSQSELEIMRNEIYARHGYSFKNKDMRYAFNQKDWYIPMGVDIRDRITDIEARNIDLIYQYESYYEEYYDDFGR